MLDMILQGLWAMIQGLVSLILWPVDAAIQAALPDVASALSEVQQSLAFINDYTVVVRSWIPIAPWALDLYLAMMFFGLAMLAANAIPGVLKLVQMVKFW